MFVHPFPDRIPEGPVGLSGCRVNGMLPVAPFEELYHAAGARGQILDGPPPLLLLPVLDLAKMLFVSGKL